MSTNKELALAMIRDHPNCHLATVKDGKPWQRVITTLRVDDDYTFWFATFKGSTKLSHIEANPEVSLSYWCDKGDMHVVGTAQTVDDLAKKEELWVEGYRQFFPDGPADASLTLLKITPGSVGFRPSGEVMEMIELLG